MKGPTKPEECAANKARGVRSKTKQKKGSACCLKSNLGLAGSGTVSRVFALSQLPCPGGRGQKKDISP